MERKYRSTLFALKGGHQLFLIKFLRLLGNINLAEIYIPSTYITLIQLNLGILNRPSNKGCFHTMRMRAIMAKEIYSIQRYIPAKRFFQFLKSSIVKKLNISTISYWYNYFSPKFGKYRKHQIINYCLFIAL